MSEIEKQINWNKGQLDDDSKDMYADRWEKLAGYYCNPNIDLETLKQIVDRPVPKQREQTEKKRGFLPGIISQTIHFGTKSIFPKYRPAFESLRIFE